MVQWTTVVVSVCLVFLVYFLVRGLRMAFSSKELPEPKEGDYTIKVVGTTRHGGYLAVMSPRKESDEDDKT